MEPLLARQNRLVLHPSLRLLEAWRDNLPDPVVQGNHQPEESLQLEQGTLQAGESLRLLGDIQPGVGIHHPVGGSCLLLEGRPRVLGDRRPVGVDMLLAAVGSLLLGVGSLLPGVGIHRIVVGILGNSSSELIDLGRVRSRKRNASRERTA